MDDVPRRLKDGRLRVQLPTEGDLKVDGLVNIGPDHPQFPIWDAWLKERGQ